MPSPWTQHSPQSSIQIIMRSVSHPLLRFHRWKRTYGRCRAGETPTAGNPGQILLKHDPLGSRPIYIKKCYEAGSGLMFLHLFCGVFAGF